MSGLVVSSMNVDFDQLKIEAKDRLSRGLETARRLPGWVWAIPAVLTVGFAWAVALSGQPTPKDEAVVTVKSVDRQPNPTVSIDPVPSGDYVPQTARPTRRRSRKRKKPPAQVAAARTVARESEPAVTPITPEAHWMETVAPPREVGALKRRSEPANDGGGTGTGGGAGNGGGDTGGQME